MKLISNWRAAWRMFSQQAFMAAGALQGAWLFLDADQKASIPAEWVTYGTIAIVALGFIGRLIEQPKVTQ
jgi:hypothetical protein